MRGRSLLAAALGFIAIGGCGEAEFPAGLSEEERRELKVGQGLVGRAALRTGFCEGSCALEDCDMEVPRELELHAVPAQAQTFVPPTAFGACSTTFRQGGAYAEGFTTEAGMPAGTLAVRLERSAYGLELPMGRYALLVVDAAGCAQCLYGYVASGGGYACEVHEVRQGEVTELDVLLEENLSVAATADHPSP